MTNTITQAEHERVDRLLAMLQPDCASIIADAIESGATPEETTLQIQEHRSVTGLARNLPTYRSNRQTGGK